jgi:class 3 adenylate cyclase
MVALRNISLLSQEDREEPAAAGVLARSFHEEAARFCREAGGILVGCWEDLALAAFGGPLEEEAPGDLARRKTPPPGPENLAVRAARFISRLPGEARSSWRFGIDLGDCSFSWSALGGYNAFGRPVVRARILSGLASRYKARILVSQAVGVLLAGAELRKLGALGAKDSGGKEPFYELLGPVKSPGWIFKKSLLGD